MGEHAHLTPLGAANLLAGHAVSYATAFLDGRHSAAQLVSNADRLFCDLLAAASHPEINGILDPVRLLTCAMMRAGRAALDPDESLERKERWQIVMAALVELVCHESRQLKKETA